MKSITKSGVTGVWILSLLLLFYAPMTPAQSDPAPQNQPVFTQQELDQMLAPIALYPDALLSQILMAATYPLEVVEAARWSKSNPSLKGDQAVKAAQSNGWDPSVTSLTAFPQILAMMDQKLDWTERLGDAFLAQQPQVMDTVQGLRQKAADAGNLRSSDQVRVVTQGQIILIEQAAPQIVYVPYYNPTVVYGPWWWDAYPPVYWDPWPGYYYRYPGFGTAVFWGIGITVGRGFFFGGCDWPHRRVDVVNVNNYYYNNYHTYYPSDWTNRTRTFDAGRNFNTGRSFVANSGAPGVWQHDPDHRRGVPYRGQSLRQQIGRASAPLETGHNFRGFNAPARETAMQLAPRPETDTRPNVRPEARNNPQPRISSPVARPDVTDRPDRRDMPNSFRAETRSTAALPAASILSGRAQPERRAMAPARATQIADARSVGERGNYRLRETAPANFRGGEARAQIREGSKHEKPRAEIRRSLHPD